MAKIGQWESMTIGELPKEVTDAAQSIVTAGNFINNLLSIALQVTNLIKSASFGYLDPIQAILDALIKEIDNYINDLGQIGLFLAGDWNLVSYPFDDLQGGYSAYERRMISRFMNKDDPTRPQISTATKVVAFFFYTSTVDGGQIHQILEPIKYFTQFFNREAPGKKSLPVPVNLKATYGIAGASIFDFRNLSALFEEGLSTDPPSTARVAWTVSATPTKDPAIPFLKPAPQGFIVEVSTIKDGLHVYYERPQADSRLTKGRGSSLVQVREHGRILDPLGKPLTLFGGADQIYISDRLKFNNTVDILGNMKPGAARIYSTRSPVDRSPIPLEMLYDVPTGKYLLQRTFFVTQTENAFFPGDGYGITLKKEDLPNEAEFTVGSNGNVTVKVLERPTTYYVRVRSVSGNPASKSFTYNIDGDTIDTPGKPVKATSSAQMGSDIGEPSTPVVITFPDENTQTYLDTITIALVVLVLSRSDLPTATFKDSPSEPDTNVADEKTGLEGLASLMKRIYPTPDFKFKEKGGRPRNFRSDLLNRCKRLANLLYNSLGSMPALEKSVVSRTKELRAWKWKDSLNTTFSNDPYIKNWFGDMTILESLNIYQATRSVVGGKTVDTPDGGGSEEFGIALNPWSLGSPEQIVERDFFLKKFGIIQRTAPTGGTGFFEFEQTLNYKKIVGGKVVSGKLPANMTQAQADIIITDNPHLKNFFRTIKRREDGKVVYKVPDEYRRIAEGVVYVRGSADFSPVAYVNQNNLIQGGSGGKVFYCRSLFSPEVYSQAALVLNLASAAFKKPAADGEWIAARLFLTMPELQQLFKSISLWLNTLKTGTKSTTNAIQQYIDFLEARIIELQQLINRITAYIQLLTQIKFPTVNGLVVLADGSDGVMAAFVGAQNKPSDSALAYGGGAVLLSGGAPSFVIDLLGG